MRGSNNDDIKKEYCFRIKFIKQNGIMYSTGSFLFIKINGFLPLLWNLAPCEKIPILKFFGEMIKSNAFCNKLNGRIKERSNSKSRRTCDDI